jgi:hypothetical protein
MTYDNSGMFRCRLPRKGCWNNTWNLLSAKSIVCLFFFSFLIKIIFLKLMCTLHQNVCFVSPKGECTGSITKHINWNGDPWASKVICLFDIILPLLGMPTVGLDYCRFTVEKILDWIVVCNKWRRPVRVIRLTPTLTHRKQSAYQST